MRFQLPRLDIGTPMFYFCSNMTAADPRSQMLSEMSQCAYRLGMAFGAEAERAAEADERVDYFRLFERCFFAVRVAAALELRLWRTPSEPREAAADREELIDRADLPDREDRDRGDDERDRDRDRDVETASLPVLLRTLNAVVADASALPGPVPAALPTLRELPAQVQSSPKSSFPKSAVSLRSSLAGSGAATALALAPRPMVRPVAGLSARRATGPPGR